MGRLVAGWWVFEGGGMWGRLKALPCGGGGGGGAGVEVRGFPRGRLREARGASYRFFKRSCQ